MFDVMCDDSDVSCMGKISVNHKICIENLRKKEKISFEKTFK